MLLSKNFRGVVAKLKCGYPVPGASLCHVCDGEGEGPIGFDPDEISCCDECGGQGWCPDRDDG